MQQTQGWIKLYRHIKDSDVYVMPPLYLRTFERLVIEANHQDKEIPYKEKDSKIIGKKLIKRGERLTSVRDICKWVAWYERGKLKVPNPKTMQNILDWLEANDMIFIYGNKGNRKETYYKVVNYNVYQDRENEEVTEKKQSGNSEVTVAGDKQEYIKNDKEIYIMSDYEDEFIKILHSIKDWPCDLKKDLDYLKILEERYPTLDMIATVKKFSDYILDNPFTKKSNHRSKLNNSCNKYVEWGICLKKNDMTGSIKASSTQLSETDKKILKELGIADEEKGVE